MLLPMGGQISEFWHFGTVIYDSGQKSHETKSLPKLPGRGLYDLCPLALLAKLYSPLLAWKDKCCMTDDKSLHSTALSPSRSQYIHPRPVPGRFIVQISKIRGFAPRSLGSLASVVLVSAVMAAQAWGVPGEQLMPAETRGFVSVPNVDTLIEHWHQTQLGQLVQDDAMRPFVEDMRKQFNEKVSTLKEKIGVTYGELKDIAGGELTVGMIEIPNARAALAMTIDTTGRNGQLETLLAKIEKELTKNGATKSTAEREGTTFVTFNIPAQNDKDIARETVYFVKDNILVASDNAKVANEMFARFSDPANSLMEVAGYKQTMERCRQEAGSLKPDASWFADPFAYAKAVQSLESADEPKKGKDYVKILSEQGFDAIKAAGGFVNLSVDGTYELLHRTAIVAPPIPGEADKYRLAMRMMKFPNQDELTANKWIPRQLATYRTFSCDLNNAFQHFGSLFDAIAGYEDAFDGVLEGLERDPYGPQIDVQKNFVSHLGERVMMVTDYEMPITTKSERFMIAVEIKDEKAIAATIEKFMKSDPNASSSEFEGKTIWEIHEAEADIPEIDIAELDPELLESDESSEEDGLGALASSAVCVTDGHLFIASHADFLRKVLAKENEAEKLLAAGDFKAVENVMSELLEGPISAKFFVRSDEAFRPVYEMIQQGKMPESESLLGRILNRMLTPPESEDEGVLREQKIDGSKLPDFEMVRRYFGPSGTVVRSDDDGWFIVGATLSKQTVQARAEGAKLSSDAKTVR
jgi:hypothetical protein